MNKDKYIRQEDFNYNHNGYRVYSDGDYDTSVNNESVGLDNWVSNLRYYIG